MLYKSKLNHTDIHTGYTKRVAYFLIQKFWMLNFKIRMFKITN